jgi:L-lactate dehydrogenase complex protein LldG
MTSRDKILKAIAANAPALSELPDVEQLMAAGIGTTDLEQQFSDTLRAIGGTVELVGSIADVKYYIGTNLLTGTRRIMTTMPGLSDILEPVQPYNQSPQSLHNVDYAVIETELAVAENGAVWVTEQQMGTRVLPFICQHLVIIANARDIVPTMHQAYEKIGSSGYGFGTFIAGPSKTADIEQSLVLGAHGARSMTVLLIA